MNKRARIGWAIQLGLPILVCFLLVFTSSISVCISLTIIALFVGVAVNLAIMLHNPREVSRLKALTRKWQSRKLKV